MIRVFRCDGKKRTWGGPERLPADGEQPETVWIDLEGPTEEEERRVLAEYFKVHALTMEDIARPRLRPDHSPHFPKVEEFPDYLLVIVNPLQAHALGKVSDAGSDSKLNSQLSAVLTRSLLITHHYEKLPSIDALRAHLEKHDDHGERGPDYLFHLVLDEMVDEYVPVLDHVDDSLDKLEEEVFARPDRSLLARLLSLKRSIIMLRKTMIYEREVLARMSRGEFALIDDRETAYYRNVYDHLIRFTELMEASREMVSDLMQTLLASQSNKLNEIMKVLTMISVTILPMSLIAGIYGMNFENNVWPDFKTSQHGFAMALLLMGLSVVGAFGLFKWMKWL
ncbi:MAG: magnesium/cobalt transporter CorA [Gemmataceae bacterium]|nr:magnesium/cobalt transporter CorA [Gemmataceae bacterium]